MTTVDPRDRAALSDPRVDAAWRALSDEEPPKSLDAAILAAARREVGAKPQSSVTRETLADRRRWWPLAAAATVAAIAVGVLQLTTPDQIGAPASDTTLVTDMPTPDLPACSGVADGAIAPGSGEARSRQRPSRRACARARRFAAAPGAGTRAARAGKAGTGGRRRTCDGRAVSGGTAAAPPVDAADAPAAAGQSAAPSITGQAAVPATSTASPVRRTDRRHRCAATACSRGVRPTRPDERR